MSNTVKVLLYKLDFIRPVVNLIVIFTILPVYEHFVIGVSSFTLVEGVGSKEVVKI